MEATREGRIAGGLVGLLVGDALGVPYEFNAPDRLPDRVEMEPPSGFRRSHPGVPPGTWSDDGAQALCLLESLLERGTLDLRDLAGRIVRWANEGHLAVDGHVFDIGIQTSTAVRALAWGGDPRTAGPAGEMDNGNGALMRVLPLALWHQGTDGELARDAADQGLPTHGHARSRLCCALACVWGRGLVDGRDGAWEHAVEVVDATFPDDRYELHERVLVDGVPRGTGYVVDSLRSVRAAMREPTYEAVVRRAIAFGHDTDTTACIAGGLAGMRDGIDAIPQRWRDALRGRDLLDPLLSRLMERARGGRPAARA